MDAVAGWPFVHVVMTCWNRLEATRQTLPALLDLTDYPEWAVTVVDDASTDGSGAWLSDEQAARNADGRRSFSLIRHRAQQGVNVSSNEAWALHAGWYCKVDNNALVLRPDWLTELVTLALALGQRRAGVVAYNLEFGALVHNYPVTDRGGARYQDRTAHNVAGKCALIPAWTRARVGMWNTNIGTPYRGADRLYALRCRLAGLMSVYHPSWREFVTRLDGKAAGETPERAAWRQEMKLASVAGVRRLQAAYTLGQLPIDDWSSPA